MFPRMRELLVRFLLRMVELIAVRRSGKLAE
jgi:hypothetical protein